MELEDTKSVAHKVVPTKTQNTQACNEIGRAPTEAGLSPDDGDLGTLGESA